MYNILSTKEDCLARNYVYSILLYVLVEHMYFSLADLGYLYNYDAQNKSLAKRAKTFDKI